MKPKIILHVGTEKTGSTSIQQFLGDNYAALMEQGILFPRTIGAPCHINLTACALDNMPNHPLRRLLGLQDETKFKDHVCNTRRTFSEEIQGAKPAFVAISDEHINAHLSNQMLLRRFKNICEEYGDIVSVVIYLRSQDKFRLSLFSEAVKAGNLSNFDLDDLLPIFENVPYRLDYLSILENLREVFGEGKLNVRLFEKDRLANGDARVDFMNQYWPMAKLSCVNSVRHNRSIDAQVIRILASVSSSLKSMNTEWSDELRGKIVQACENIFTGPGIVLPQKAHRRFMRQFEKDNKVIKGKYFINPTDQETLFLNEVRNEDAPFYPDCNLSWPEFFIKFVAYLLSQGKKEEYSKELSYCVINATCPVCGEGYLLDQQIQSREGRLCTKCGASGRAQAIAYHISMLLLGELLPLARHRQDKSKRIVGLSDGAVYAKILDDRYAYTNTFFHRDPFLDITSPSQEYHESADILISTEVFEHVIGPSISAFIGAFKVLKPGGHMILTVPYINRGDSIEHYAEGLKEYKSYETSNGDWVAELIYEDGRVEIDNQAKFHGGPGKTPEIRLFNRDRLMSEMETVGFVDIQFHDENMPNYGINWGAASRIITAMKPPLHRGEPE